MPERRFSPRRISNAIDRANAGLVDIPVDVEDHGDELWVTADLPGYRTQDIDVTVNREVLRIEATPRTSGTAAGRGLRRRVLRLPEPVLEETARAEYHRGVLRVRMEKRNPEQVRSIPVE